MRYTGAMIEASQGRIDYDEFGSEAADAPVIAFVPGSCSTGAAWRPVMTALGERYRFVTTSLLGYGGTDERRRPDDPSITHEAQVVEAVLRRAKAQHGGRPVHLVGHSFGALVALAVALRGKVRPQSLTVIEAPAAEVLRLAGEDALYRGFRAMTDAYFDRHRAGDPEAIATMIDFYGGPGTFAAWPPKVRAYAVVTTPVNLLDWAGAYGFAISPATLMSIDVPTMVLRGGASPEAARRANEIVADAVRDASLVTIPGAAHFMIATHASQVAKAIAQHVGRNGEPR